MLKLKVFGEKLADKEMKAIYGAEDCNCLPGCDCSPTGLGFTSPFNGHMKVWEGRFGSPIW